MGGLAQSGRNGEFCERDWILARRHNALLNEDLAEVNGDIMREAPCERAIG
jgi:hypothetical protein